MRRRFTARLAEQLLPTACKPCGCGGVANYCVDRFSNTENGFDCICIDANAVSLSVSGYTLSPTFSSSVTSYTLSPAVPYGTASLPVAVTLNCTMSRPSLQGTQLGSHSGTLTGTLATGPATVNLDVLVTSTTFYSTTNTKTYRIAVTVSGPSTNSELTALALSGGCTLAPVFSSSTLSYTCTVPASTTSTGVTPVSYSGSQTVSGVATANSAVTVINLNPGATTSIPIVVTAQAGSKTTYTVSVTRPALSTVNTLATLSFSPAGTLSPVFSSAVSSFSFRTASSLTTSTTVSAALTDPSSSMTINGVAAGSLAVSQPAAGASVSVTIAVTSQSGATRNVVISMYRLSNVASLSSLVVTAVGSPSGAITLSPSFASSTTIYTASVPYGVTDVTFTATPTSGLASSLAVLAPSMTLSPGSASASAPLTIADGTTPNVFDIRATSEDPGVSFTYRVSIVRQRDTVADLVSLSCNFVLSPTFSPSVTLYSATVVDFSATACTPTKYSTAAFSSPDTDGVSRSVPLSPHDIDVTAQNGATKRYRILITAGVSSNLASLQFSTGMGLSPAFSGSVTVYSLSIPFSATSLSVTATAVYAPATLTCNTFSITSGVPYGVNHLASSHSVVVTSGAGSMTYSISVSRLPQSTDSSLSSLVLSAPGSWSPAFNPSVTAYTYTVASASTTSTTFTPTLTFPWASVTVGGSVTVSGSASSPTPLTVGATVSVSIVVTAESGATQTYTVGVYVISNVATLSLITTSPAATLSPAFLSTTTTYTAAVPHSVTSMTFSAQATAAAVSQLVLNPGAINPPSAAPRALTVGTNTFSVVCVSEDTLVTKTYYVTVERAADDNAELSNLQASVGGAAIGLTPSFQPLITTYTVTDHRATLTLRPTAAAPLTIQGIKVNGATVSSGAESSPIALAVGIPLVVVTQVTAQNSGTKDYTVTVTRLAGDPSDSTLSSLSHTDGTLSPAFSPTVTVYSLSLPFAVNGVKLAFFCSSVLSTLEHQLASDVNPTAGTCGSDLEVGQIPYPGEQVLEVNVTADDTTSTKYQVTIRRVAPSSDTSLSSLALSVPGSFSPNFSPLVTSYSWTVNSTGSVTSVTAVPSSPLATLKIQGVSVTPGSASGFLDLAVGINVITVEVTAESQAAANYTVTVYRRSGNPLLSSATLSGVTGLAAFQPTEIRYDGGQLNGTLSLTIMAVPAHPLATMKYLPGSVSLVSGVPSAPLSLPPSVRTTLSIVVYSEDHLFALRYDFNVTAYVLPSSVSALASLGGGALALVPTFAPNVTAYTLAGPAWPSAPLSSISFAPAVPVHAAATVILPPSAAVGPGVTTFAIVCVAENGVQKTTYTVEVTNQGPPPAMPAPAASLVGPRGLTLTWAAAASLAGVPVHNYTVLRNGTAIATVPAPGATTFSDGGLSPLTHYTYAIVANTPLGSSPAAPASVLLTRTLGEVILAPSPAGGDRYSWALIPPPGPGVVVTIAFACPAGACVTVPASANATDGTAPSGSSLASGELLLLWPSSTPASGAPSGSGQPQGGSPKVTLSATPTLPSGLFAAATLLVAPPAVLAPSATPTPTATPLPGASSTTPIALVACLPVLPSMIVFPGDMVPICADISGGAPGFTASTVLVLLGMPCQQTIVESATRAKCAAPIAGAAVTGNEVKMVARNPAISNSVTLPLVVFRDAEFSVALLRTSLSEDDKAAEPAFSVSFSPALPSAVKVSVDFEDATLGAREVSLSSLEQTIPANSADAVVFSARGLPDRIRDGNTQVHTFVRAGNRVSRVVLTTRDAAPLVLTLVPSVTPLGGRSVTLTGIHIDEVVGVFAGSKPCNVTSTVRRPAAAGRRSALQLQDNEVALGIQLPRQDSVGYYEVQLVNANSSTVGSLPLVLYYTDKCPEPGLWYRDGECMQCPVGATCPGGDRLWPKAGYWNPGETSGFVEACPVPSSCEACEGHECYLKTAASPCAEGYEGFLCSQCSPGYDLLNGACKKCPPKTFSLSLIVLDVLLWVGIALSASMIEREHALTAVTNFVIAVQEVATMGQMLSSTLPVPLLRAYKVLYLFSGDVNFFNPSCSGHVPFVKQFLIRLLYMLGLVLPMLLSCFFAYLLSLGKAGVDKAERRAHYVKRAKRCVIIHSVVIFFPIAVLSLEALSCLPMADGKARLAKFPWIECLSQDHIGPLALSSLLLCLYALVYPAVYYFNVRSGRDFDPEVWDFSTEPYVPRFRHLWLLERFVTISLAVALGAFVTMPKGQLITLLASYATMLLTIIFVRPLKSGFDNLLTGLFCSVQVSAVVVNFLTRSATAGANRRSVFYGAYVVAALALLLILFYFATAVHSVIWSKALSAEEKVALESRRKGGAGGAGGKEGEHEIADLLAHADLAEVDIPDIQVIASAGTFTPAPSHAGSASASTLDGMFAWFSADQVSSSRSGGVSGATAGVGAVGGGHSPEALLAAGPSALSAPADLKVYVTPVFAPRPTPAAASLLGLFSGLFGADGRGSSSAVPALPPWWKGDPEASSLVPLGPDMVACVQNLVNRTTISEYIGKGSDNRSLTHKHLAVQSVELVQTPRLWKTFAGSVQSTLTEAEVLNRVLPGVPVATDPDPQFAAALPLPPALAEVNAKWLWHGTDVPEAVCVGGFDDRVNVKGLFGRHGIYFSENASKSDEYCSPSSDGTCVLILGLVIIGVPYVALTPLPKLCRPPCFLGHDTTACGCSRFDSVLGEVDKNYPGAYLKKYREFVVYDRRVTLPVLKVVYKRV